MLLTSRAGEHSAIHPEHPFAIGPFVVASLVDEHQVAMPAVVGEFPFVALADRLVGVDYSLPSLFGEQRPP